MQVLNQNLMLRYKLKINFTYRADLEEKNLEHNYISVVMTIQ